MAGRSGPPQIGDHVRLRVLPPWVDELPEESRAVFEFCVGRTCIVSEMDGNGLLVLDPGEEVDRRFGGYMNDIRVEPGYVELVARGTSVERD